MERTGSRREIFEFAQGTVCMNAFSAFVRLGAMLGRCWESCTSVRWLLLMRSCLNTHEEVTHISCPVLMARIGECKKRYCIDNTP